MTSAGLLILTLCVALGTSADVAATECDRGSAADADQLQFIQANGVKLAVRIEGSGVPVILVHGEGYTHELWREQIEAITRRYQFISYDRRGHGMSDDPVTGYSVIAHAEDINAIMSHLGIRDAHFVVHSRGGVIILQLLRLYPSKIRSITFADATIPVVEIPADSAFRPAITRLKGPPPSLEEALIGREHAKLSRFTLVAQSREEVRVVLERMVSQYSPRVAMNPQRRDKYSAMNLGPWNERDFPTMSGTSKPILLIVGEKTDVFFIKGATVADRRWPNTQLRMIPGTDHLLMLEEPVEFNEMLLKFLQKVEVTRAKRIRE